MLTASQCRVVAYQLMDDGGNGEDIVCFKCVQPTEDCSANEIIEYSASELAQEQESSVLCDRCGKEIAEYTAEEQEPEDEEDEEPRDATADDRDGLRWRRDEVTRVTCGAFSALRCAGCGSYVLLLLGTLRQRTHYRCRHCGLDGSRDVKEAV